jgi:hypothetical protein
MSSGIIADNFPDKLSSMDLDIVLKSYPDTFPDMIPDTFPDMILDTFPDMIPDTFPDTFSDIGAGVIGLLGDIPAKISTLLHGWVSG